MLWKVPVASSVMLWWTLFISQLYCLTVMPWVSRNHLDWRVWQVQPSPKLVRFVRVSVVIVGRGHCLKATKTSVLTEPRRKEHLTGSLQEPGNTRGPDLDEWKEAPSYSQEDRNLARSFWCTIWRINQLSFWVWCPAQCDPHFFRECLINVDHTRWSSCSHQAFTPMSGMMSPEDERMGTRRL